MLQLTHCFFLCVQVLRYLNAIEELHFSFSSSLFQHKTFPSVFLTCLKGLQHILAAHLHFLPVFLSTLQPCFFVNCSGHLNPLGNIIRCPLKKRKINYFDENVKQIKIVKPFEMPMISKETLSNPRGINVQGHKNIYRPQ